ncbi:hypothetical protein [Streptomyces sioyaensis]|uniref:hypothetical protein n=1 Tax=Streptomyces sioyaensis TaxID=67364 RepID=UPI0037AC6F88
MVTTLALLPGFTGGDDKGKTVAVTGLSAPQEAAPRTRGGSDEKIEIRQTGQVCCPGTLVTGDMPFAVFE